MSGSPVEIRLRAELDAVKKLAARLTERLAVAQAENESAYRAAYDAMCGPHLCSDLPFGTEPTAGEPGAERLKAAAARETEPARRQAWGLIRRDHRNDEGDTTHA